MVRIGRKGKARKRCTTRGGKKGAIVKGGRCLSLRQLSNLL